MKIKKYLSKELIEKGIDLTEVLGVFELAWNYHDVFEVLDELNEKKIVIVGGDVLNKELSYTYDNWVYDEFYSLDSINYAKNYIYNYFKNNGEDFFYVLVLNDE